MTSLSSLVPLAIWLTSFATLGSADLVPASRRALRHQQEERDLGGMVSSILEPVEPVVEDILPFFMGLRAANTPNSTEGLKNMIQQGRRNNTDSDGQTKPKKYGFVEGAKQPDGFDSDLENAQVSFLADLQVGSQTFSVIVDTGSSNTWVGADQQYQPGADSAKTSEGVSVSYGSGAFTGSLYNDTVTLGDLHITNQGIGVADRAQGFNQGIDGILGLGPTPLTAGTLFPDSERTVPTLVDQAFYDGLTDTRELGIYFEPSESPDNALVGEMTIGGYDTDKTTSCLMTTPITTTDPSSGYWGIDMTVNLGDDVLLNSNAGIVDTGTTLVYLATDAYNAYTQAIGANFDQISGLLSIPAQDGALDNIPDLVFTIPGSERQMVMNNYAQLVPKALYQTFGLNQAFYYSWITDIGTQSGQGLDFILGQKFLERFYSVYSLDNSTVSFAETAFTFPDSL